MTELVHVPASARPDLWSPEQAGLMEFAGLTWKSGEQRMFAPTGVAQAFIRLVERSGLDPFAKQIYAAQIGGKWSIITGIDGMRVIAQRTGEYEGQTAIEWTADGASWVSAWLGKTPPAAARVGIYRKGFREPLYQVVTWDEFGKKGGNWDRIPAHMLGIRAESHALRRAFPNDLSGLYTPEDITDETVIEPSEDWLALIESSASKAELKTVTDRCKNANEVTDEIRHAALVKFGTFRDKPTDESAPDESDPAWVAEQERQEHDR